MGKNRGLDRLTAERLLRGDPADRSSVPEALRPLTDVLAAAAEPAHDDELAGETAALAAFRAAQPYRVPGGRSFRLKVAAIVMATAASTGAVAAAAAGILPVDNPLPAPVPPTQPTAGGISTSGRPSTAPSLRASPSPPPSTRSSGKRSTASKVPRTTTSPSLADLCRVYISRGGPLDDPAFAALVRAAGGEDFVSRFCDQLTTPTHPTHSYPTYPSHPTYPTNPSYPTYKTYTYPSYPFP